MSSVSEKVDFKVSGMSCSGCANAVKQALKQLDGVERASVNQEDSTASVVYDAHKVTPADFKNAVESCGYAFDGIQ